MAKERSCQNNSLHLLLSPPSPSSHRRGVRMEVGRRDNGGVSSLKPIYFSLFQSFTEYLNFYLMFIWFRQCNESFIDHLSLLHLRLLLLSHTLSWRSLGLQLSLRLGHLITSDTPISKLWWKGWLTRKCCCLIIKLNCHYVSLLYSNQSLTSGVSVLPASLPVSKAAAVICFKDIISDVDWRNTAESVSFMFVALFVPFSASTLFPRICGGVMLNCNCKNTLEEK